MAARDCRPRHVDLDPVIVSRSPVSALAMNLDSRVSSQLAGGVWKWSRPGWVQAGWWDAELRPAVRELLWLPVGRDLLDRLTALAATDATSGYPRGECPHPHGVPSLEERVGEPGHPCACQIVVIAAWAAVASWVTAVADRAVVDAAGGKPVDELLVPTRPDLGVVTDPAVEDLAPALRVSPGSARYRLAALRRVHGLPRLRYAVTQGLVIGWHAQAVATDLRHLPQESRGRVIDVLLQRIRDRRRRGLRDWTCTELRAQAKAIAARLDLDLASRRREAHRGRGVRLQVHDHGAATISADLAEDVAARIFHRLTALATGLPADSDDPDDTHPEQHGRRSLDQRRADVFADLLLGPPPGSGAGHATDCADSVEAAAAAVSGGEVAVIVDAATLLGLADHPGFIPGCGPVPAEVARALAADRRWRAWLTRTTTAGSQVVATSPGTYRPTAAVARLVRAREPYCRMPGCRSVITDLDHIVAFPRGQTVPQNLQPLCRRHHRLKTHSRWRISTDSDGDPDDGSAGTTHTWTSPTGITHTDHPEPYWPDSSQ